MFSHHSLSHKNPLSFLPSTTNNNNNNSNNNSNNNTNTVTNGNTNGPQTILRLGTTERLVLFHCPNSLLSLLEHSPHDGYVRIISTTTSNNGTNNGTNNNNNNNNNDDDDDDTNSLNNDERSINTDTTNTQVLQYEGDQIHIHDIVCEAAGVDMRHPISSHMWKLTRGLLKVAPRPIEIRLTVERDENDVDDVEEEKEEQVVVADVVNVAVGVTNGTTSPTTTTTTTTTAMEEEQAQDHNHAMRAKKHEKEYDALLNADTSSIGTNSNSATEINDHSRIISRIDEEGGGNEEQGQEYEEKEQAVNEVIIDDDEDAQEDPSSSFPFGNLPTCCDGSYYQLEMIQCPNSTNNTTTAMGGFDFSGVMPNTDKIVDAYHDLNTSIVSATLHHLPGSLKRQKEAQEEEEEEKSNAKTASAAPGMTSPNSTNNGTITILRDPFQDVDRFGPERTIIFHTESLGIKLHRSPTEGIVHILHVTPYKPFATMSSSSAITTSVTTTTTTNNNNNIANNNNNNNSNNEKPPREGPDNGYLEAGDAIMEVGGVDIRHKVIGMIEWADMVHFIKYVGRPLEMVVAKDKLFTRERAGVVLDELAAGMATKKLEKEEKEEDGKKLQQQQQQQQHEEQEQEERAQDTMLENDDKREDKEEHGNDEEEELVQEYSFENDNVLKAFHTISPSPPEEVKDRQQCEDEEEHDVAMEVESECIEEEPSVDDQCQSQEVKVEEEQLDEENIVVLIEAQAEEVEETQLDIKAVGNQSEAPAEEVQSERANNEEEQQEENMINDQQEDSFALFQDSQDEPLETPEKSFVTAVDTINYSTAKNKKTSPPKPLITEARLKPSSPSSPTTISSESKQTRFMSIYPRTTPPVSKPITSPSRGGLRVTIPPSESGERKSVSQLRDLFSPISTDPKVSASTTSPTEPKSFKNIWSPISTSAAASPSPVSSPKNSPAPPPVSSPKAVMTLSSATSPTVDNKAIAQSESSANNASSTEDKNKYLEVKQSDGQTEPVAKVLPVDEKRRTLAKTIVKDKRVETPIKVVENACGVQTTYDNLNSVFRGMCVSNDANTNVAETIDASIHGTPLPSPEKQLDDTEVSSFHEYVINDLANEFASPNKPIQQSESRDDTEHNKHRESNALALSAKNSSATDNKTFVQPKSINTVGGSVKICAKPEKRNHLLSRWSSESPKISPSKSKKIAPLAPKESPAKNTTKNNPSFSSPNQTTNPFNHSSFHFDGNDSPFCGNVKFASPMERVATSALFSQAFVVHRNDGETSQVPPQNQPTTNVRWNVTDSPLFVVRKTLTEEKKSKTSQASSYLQFESPVERVQPEESLFPRLQRHEVDPVIFSTAHLGLKEGNSMESETSIYDDPSFALNETIVYADEAEAQADCCALDSICGDNMFEGLVQNCGNFDSHRQAKEKINKVPSPRRENLLKKLRMRRKKVKAQIDYGNLDEDDEERNMMKGVRKAHVRLAYQNIYGQSVDAASQYCSLDNEIEF